MYEKFPGHEPIFDETLTSAQNDSPETGLPDKEQIVSIAGPETSGNRPAIYSETSSIPAEELERREHMRLLLPDAGLLSHPQEHADEINSAFREMEALCDGTAESCASYATVMIQWAARGGNVFLTTSGGQESELLAHIARQAIPPPNDIHVVFVDTTLLPEATQNHVNYLQSKYGLTMHVMKPDPEKVVAAFTAYPRWNEDPTSEGYQVVTAALKQEPMERGLAELERALNVEQGARMVWLRNQRRDQNEHRAGMPSIEVGKMVVRLNPTLPFSNQMVKEYLETHGLRANLEHIDVTKPGSGECRLRYAGMERE
ncbi:phosphoadenosine phosphosulfate reductase family protein [Patescibacteria group bacterium]|nr:phosphoadenosine phosphosulfate reductase family protein [Patescibacteria group bacterium]